MMFRFLESMSDTSLLSVLYCIDTAISSLLLVWGGTNDIRRCGLKTCSKTVIVFSFVDADGAEMTVYLLILTRARSETAKTIQTCSLLLRHCRCVHSNPLRSKKSGIDSRRFC